jgi:hypothetical protein
MKSLPLLLAAAAYAGPAAADPLMDSIKAAGGTICFSRTYDAAWLKAHPGQTLREARFAVTYDRKDQAWPAMRVMLRSAGKPMYLFGGCGYEASGINRGVDNAILDPTYKLDSGLSCHMMTDVTGASAEEGGDFPAQWGDGGKFIQAHLPDSVAAWRSYDVRGSARFVDLGRADRIIRLTRAPASECRELVAKFAPGHPDY